MLGDEAVGAGLEPAQHVHGVGLAGADDDGDDAVYGVGLEASAEVEAAVAGEVEVAEDDVEVFLIQAPEAGFGVGGEDDFESGLFENEAEVLGLSRTVLDDDHARHGSVLWRPVTFFISRARLPLCSTGPRFRGRHGDRIRS